MGRDLIPSSGRPFLPSPEHPYRLWSPLNLQG